MVLHEKKEHYHLLLSVEVAKKLLYAAEEREKKYQEHITQLNAQQAPSWDKITSLEARLKEAEVGKCKETITNLEKKVDLAEVALR